MSPITYDQAYEATNPSQTEAQREQAALALIAGTAANEAYWDSRGELEALKAKAAGHGQVVPPPDAAAVETGPPTTGVSPTENGGFIDSTSVDATTEQHALPAESPDKPPPADAQSLPSPDNPTEAVAKLRKQLSDAGIQPEA